MSRLANRPIIGLTAASTHLIALSILSTSHCGRGSTQPSGLQHSSPAKLTRLNIIRNRETTHISYTNLGTSYTGTERGEERDVVRLELQRRSE